MSWHSLGPEVATGGNALTKSLGRAGMRICGWRIEGAIPDVPKMIIAVAPHTSNFDFALTVGVIWGFGLRASYLAKHSLFRFPLGAIMRAFGGIPVERGASRGMVDEMAARFAARDKLILGITPEGTRSNVREWKQGFVLIAAAADVPILPAIVNYDTKVVRFHDLIRDVSDPDRSLAAVQAAATTGAPRKSGIR